MRGRGAVAYAQLILGEAGDVAAAEEDVAAQEIGHVEVEAHLDHSVVNMEKRRVDRAAEPLEASGRREDVAHLDFGNGERPALHSVGSLACPAVADVQFGLQVGRAARLVEPAAGSVADVDVWRVQVTGSAEVVRAPAAGDGADVDVTQKSDRAAGLVEGSRAAVADPDGGGVEDARAAQVIRAASRSVADVEGGKDAVPAGGVYDVARAGGAHGDGGGVEISAAKVQRADAFGLDAEGQEAGHPVGAGVLGHRSPAVASDFLGDNGRVTAEDMAADAVDVVAHEKSREGDG
ncbi:MAG: hypothetical protein NTY65_07425 [Planctomycetota bacterium]|nr:hypothetical protein [Planctomycetota bacterium]